MQLEGMAVIGDRLVKEGEVPSDEELPLLLIAQLTTREVVTYYNEGIPADLQRMLAECIHTLEFPGIDPLLDMLASQNMPVRAHHFLTYLFPLHPDNPTDRVVMRYGRQDPRVQAIGFGGFAEHVFGIESDGRIASACVSARENEQCGEAWVYTDPAYRDQGLAQKVVGAWAKSLTMAGKIPFYSHEFDNTASAGLAKRLGLEPIFEELNITQAAE
jgi:GNAT superfamily N-acetyltransferase